MSYIQSDSLKKLPKDLYLQCLIITKLTMNKRNILTMILLAIILISVVAILIINQTEIVSKWTKESISLLKQYLKVFGFLSVMGLVYLRLQKPEMDRPIEEEGGDEQ